MSGTFAPPSDLSATARLEHDVINERGIQLPQARPLLAVHDLAKSFGRPVIQGVNLSVKEGYISALLGANGAGKSTLFNIACGLTRADSGSVVFDGTDISRYPAHRISRIGIGRLFQDVRVFASLSAIDNVLVGHSSRSESLAGLFVNSLRVKRDESEARRRAMQLLEYVELSVHEDRSAADLSFGQQKRVALAR
jgi:ABC-type branched-subunit amino acid transport system ATPase component